MLMMYVVQARLRGGWGWKGWSEWRQGGGWRLVEWLVIWTIRNITDNFQQTFSQFSSTSLQNHYLGNPQTFTMFVNCLQLQWKGWKSQYLFIFASTFALKAVSSTDKNPRRQTTRLMTWQNFHFLLSLLKAKRFCWEPRSSSLPQAPPSWYKTTLNLPAGLH